ncbi:uncharacterized protein [Dermacentor andersoni]|uniref:uncharacterized protein n=1 Tax=Dermacentor andersoni TaxID=34620 RepID=UPI002155655C|nr:uncharacterized protein LOC126544007 [Dermacentor andersoni]
MATLKARLLLVVAYVASVAAVVSVERYWHDSGYRFSDLLRRNDYVAALLLVFALIGIILSALIVAAGLVNLATRALANHGCDGSCQHQRRQHNGNPNNIDVAVQPTDTTVAAGGPALVAPHYNVSLMHLGQPRQPAPSCPPQDNYPAINQGGPSIKVEPKYYARN